MLIVPAPGDGWAARCNAIIRAFAGSVKGKGFYTACFLFLFQVQSQYSSRQQEDCVVEQEQTVDELLGEILRRIHETTTPEQIILFGSYARGEAGPDSDLDLLVVVQGVSHPRQESTRIRRALRGLLVPIDVIVATPEHLETYRNSPGLIYGPALEEGRIRYERSTAA
jgi:predicted nucleotidyltransferase